MFRTVSIENAESGDSGKRFSTVLQWWDVSASPVPAWQATCTQNVKHLLNLTGKGGMEVWQEKGSKYVSLSKSTVRALLPWLQQM